MVQHQGHRFGVVHDPLDLAPRKRRIEADGREPALLGGQLPAQHVDIVGQGVGEDVAGPEAPGPEPVHQLMGAPASSANVSVTPDGHATTAG